MGNIKNILFLFPVMGYYLFEAMVASVFITFAWKFFLEPLTNIHVTYLQWVAVIWIVKVIFFDVFKLIAGLSTIQNEPNNQNQNTETHE